MSDFLRDGSAHDGSAQVQCQRSFALTFNRVGTLAVVLGRDEVSLQERFRHGNEPESDEGEKGEGYEDWEGNSKPTSVTLIGRKGHCLGVRTFKDLSGRDRGGEKARYDWMHGPLAIR